MRAWIASRTPTAPSCAVRISTLHPAQFSPFACAQDVTLMKHMCSRMHTESFRIPVPHDAVGWSRSGRLGYQDACVLPASMQQVTLSLSSVRQCGCQTVADPLSHCTCAAHKPVSGSCQRSLATARLLSPNAQSDPRNRNFPAGSTLVSGGACDGVCCPEATVCVIDPKPYAAFYDSYKCCASGTVPGLLYSAAPSWRNPCIQTAVLCAAAIMPTWMSCSPQVMHNTPEQHGGSLRSLLLRSQYR